jgi:hypothetical protein
LGFFSDSIPIQRSRCVRTLPAELCPCRASASISSTLPFAASPSLIDTAADNPLVLPTTPSAFVTPLFLLHFAPLMRKGVSEVGLHNALAAFSREVAARRMGCKRAATLIYLGVALFRSDQMITEKEIGTGPAGTAFAHSSTTAIRPPTIAPWTSLHRRLATIHADVMLSSPPTSILLCYTSPLAILCPFNHLPARGKCPPGYG